MTLLGISGGIILLNDAIEGLKQRLLLRLGGNGRRLDQPSLRIDLQRKGHAIGCIWEIGREREFEILIPGAAQQNNILIGLLKQPHILTRLPNHVIQRLKTGFARCGREPGFCGQGGFCGR